MLLLFGNGKFYPSPIKVISLALRLSYPRSPRWVPKNFPTPIGQPCVVWRNWLQGFSRKVEKCWQNGGGGGDVGCEDGGGNGPKQTSPPNNSPGYPGWLISPLVTRSDLISCRNGQVRGFSVNAKPGNGGNSVEHTPKLLIRLGEYHNDCIHQVWYQSPERLVQKGVETTKVWHKWTDEPTSLFLKSSGGTRLGSAKSTITSLVSMKVDDRNRF